MAFKNKNFFDNLSGIDSKPYIIAFNNIIAFNTNNQEFTILT